MSSETTHRRHLHNSHDRRLAEQTGRDRPHNYGWEEPEPCVGCGESLTRDDDYKLADGWLYCQDCEPEVYYRNCPRDLYDHVQPVADAAGYIHVGVDSAYHPLGGYWVPVDEETAETDHPPSGELIHYPADDDREPSIVGEDELPDWVEVV